MTRTNEAAALGGSTNKKARLFGPWYAFGASVVSEDPAAFKPGTPLQIVACLGDDGDERAAQEQEDNARLMAASPDFLSASRLALNAIEGLMDIVAGDPEHDIGAMAAAEYARRHLVSAIRKAGA